MPVNLEIVSPERLLLSRPVDMVVIPASEGDMGVLEGHAPAIVMLRGGIIALYEGERVTDQMYVAGGFAEVTPERCTVLAEEAMSSSDLDRGAIEAELQVIEGNLPSLREQVGRAGDADRDRLAAELRSLERQQAVARAKLQALAASAH
jgi:F-type H+-transporting ATPase subunit epsilon